MKSTLLSLCLLLGLVNHNFSQSHNPTASQSVAKMENQLTLEDYKPLVEAGLATLESEKYDSCITYFKKAFTIKQTSYLSTLRAAACGYSAGDKAYLDQQLDKAFSLNWSGSKMIWDNYKEFDYLRGTEFENRINKLYYHCLDTSGVNRALMNEFAEIGESDQRYRKEMRGIREKYGWDSPQMDSMWALQNPIDSMNTLRICAVIDSCGYPGKSVVGPGEASTAFLVIQHAKQEVQEKYLDIITTAADEGEVRWSSVALLVDRVNMKQGKPQIYGSQLRTDQESGDMYFAEIAEPFKIDSIRATVGLGPLQSYADHWEFKWDPDKHLKKIAELKIREEKEKAKAKLEEGKSK